MSRSVVVAKTALASCNFLIPAATPARKNHQSGDLRRPVHLHPAGRDIGGDDMSGRAARGMLVSLDYLDENVTAWSPRSAGRRSRANRRVGQNLVV
jgi:hypothetical protein